MRYTERVTSRAFPFLAAALVACATDPLTPNPVVSPLWEAKNIAGYGETAMGAPPDQAFGWDLRVAGGVARWRECTEIDACSAVERERPASELLAFERVGKTSDADGHDVDVLKLSLAPEPKYVVPVRRLPR